VKRLPKRSGLAERFDWAAPTPAASFSVEGTALGALIESGSATDVAGLVTEDVTLLAESIPADPLRGRAGEDTMAEVDGTAWAEYLRSNLCGGSGEHEAAFMEHALAAAAGLMAPLLGCCSAVIGIPPTPCV